MSVPTRTPAVKKSGTDLSLAEAIKGLAIAVGNVNLAVRVLEATLTAQSDAISVSTESSIPSLLSSPISISRSQLEESGLLHYDPVTNVMVSATGDFPPARTPAVTREANHWYAVTVGREPGIFYGSDTIQDNIHRIRFSKATPCDTEDEAKKVFNRDLDAGLMERVVYTEAKRTLITRAMVPYGSYVVPK